MILDENEVDHFDHDFDVFEKYRMYPPSHTGDIMIKVNDSHLRALARAVHFVRSGMTTKMTPKLLNSIQRDIDLLDEAHKYIRQQINEPGLFINPETIAQGNIGENHGDSSQPASVS